MNHAHIHFVEHMQRLKISGLIGSVEVRRGMNILDRDGEPAGLVAGVVAVSGSEQISDLVISPVPPTGDYRLAAVESVGLVGEDCISLTLPAAELASLPPHNPD